MEVLERLVEAAKGQRSRVALPEPEDPRVLHAARRLVADDIAEPVLVGAAADVRQAAAREGVDLDGIILVDPATDPHREAYAGTYAAARAKADAKMALRMLRRPLYYAGMMVRAGHADTLVAGVATPTRRVIEAGRLTIGSAARIKTPSSFFLMSIPNFAGQGKRDLIYADCGVNVDPDPDALADIAIASAESARQLLGEEPRVAMLSFSTKGSAQHARADKVLAALDLVRTRAPDILIDGEFQGDAALIPEVAAKKVNGESAVAGRANVLVFPDLDAGNIAYKLTQYTANATAIGPVLQGFAKPVSDLSRGASTDDIVHAAAVALAQLKKGD